MQNSPTSKNGQLEQKEKLSPEVLEAVNLCDASFKDYKSNAFAVELAALKSFIGTVNGLSAAFAILFKVIDDPKKVMKGRRIRRAATIRAQHDYQVSYALKLPTNAILKHKKFHYFKNEGVWSYIFLNADDNPSDPEFNPKINRLDELKGSQTLLSKMNVESFNPFPIESRNDIRSLSPAQIDLDGETIDDFRIEQKGNSLHVLNAPSPAATASLAIGDQIREMAEERFALRDHLNQ